MKFLKLSVFVLTLFVIASCSQKPAKTTEQVNVKYYRQLLFSETPWDTERGSYPLTAEEAKTVNNYKLTYNEKGQLQSVEYNRNGVLLGYSSLGAAKVEYTYEGDKQIKKFYSDKGEPTKRDGASVLEYTLDATGMRTALRFLGDSAKAIENRNNIHNYVWTKLPDGMIQEKRYNLAGDSVVMNPFCPFFELRFSYDANGFVTRMANYDNDTLYNCTAENCGDIGVSYFQFDNNDKGDVLSFSVHNTTGRMSNLYWGWAKRVNVVDVNGNVVETSMYDQDEEYLGGKGVPVTQTVYDEFGAVVKRVSMDAKKVVMNNPQNGVATVEYKYDAEGRRTETIQYDKDGVVVPAKN
jgi:hypothetical protein